MRSAVPTVGRSAHAPGKTDVVRTSAKASPMQSSPVQAKASRVFAMRSRYIVIVVMSSPRVERGWWVRGANQGMGGG